MDEELLTNKYLLYGILILKIQRAQTPTFIFFSALYGVHVILFAKGERTLVT